MIRRLERAVLSREEAAKRELDRIIQAEKVLHQKLIEIEAAAAASNLDLEKLLDDPGNLDAVSSQTARLRSAAEAAGAALDGLRDRRRKALESLFAARAATLREQSDQLVSEAANLETKTAKLFAEIAAIEGLPTLSFADCVLPNEIRSAALRRDADALLEKAAKCRIPPASMIDLQPATLPALIDKVIVCEAITPTISELTDWFQSALRRLRKEAPKFEWPTLRVRLYWGAEGRILSEYPNRSALEALVRASGAAHVVTVTGGRS